MDRLSLGALRVRKIGAGLVSPLARRALSRGVAASVEHAKPLRGLDFDFVVDVGANRGQFALFAHAAFPRARIVSFEPLAGPAAIHRQVFRNEPRVRLVIAGLSVVRGRRVMHVASDVDSSSLLAIGPRQSAAFGSRETGTETIEVGLLEDYIGPEAFGRSSLLKIDTQGTELDVLRGAGSLLARFRAVYCELSFVELYEGQALAAEVIAFLAERGFRLAGIFNQAEADGKALQADGLFVAEPAQRPAASRST